MNIKHGDRYTRLYDIWRGIKSRCYTQSSTSYKNYGLRGVKMCDEWLDYQTFKRWALANGYKDNLTIDRIDVNGDYTPNNCRWVSYKENSNNKRNNRYIEYNGKIKTLTEWAEEYHIKVGTLWARLNKGWTIEKALNN